MTGRLAWLGQLPRTLIHSPVALVHASTDSLWRNVREEAADAELEEDFGKLGQPLAVYGHIHLPYVRKMAEMVVANAGSVGLPFDGDRRASYLLVDDGTPAIQRVEYDVEKEMRELSIRKFPHHDWVAKMLASGYPQVPPSTSSVDLTFAADHADAQ